MSNPLRRNACLLQVTSSTSTVPYTTGLAYFAECQRHSAKAGKHSVKKSPSVALGEAHTAFLLPAKPTMPSAFSRALGKRLPCATPHSAKKNETGRPNGTNGTGRGGELCRVPDSWHSAKIQSSPSARRVALGEVWIFAELCHAYTRQICFPVNRKMVALPSVRLKTLGKACCFFVFFLFFM